MIEVSELTKRYGDHVAVGLVELRRPDRAW